MELAFYYRFSSTRFNYNYKNGFLAIFLVIRVKKLVFFNYIVFINMSLVKRSLFIHYTPCYRSHNSDSKNECFRVFIFLLILTYITSSYTPISLLLTKGDLISSILGY